MRATTIGSIVHKALEGLANKHHSKQRGLDSFDDEDFGPTNINTVNSSTALARAFALYKEREPHHDYNEEMYKECEGLLDIALTYQNGFFNPENHKIEAVEKFFEFYLEEDWAKWEYDGEVGKLKVRGTIDLLARDNNFLLLRDWKTGKLRDKNYDKLMQDPQMLLYYWALRRLYPKDYVLMSIFFIREKTPFYLPFDDSHIVKFEQMMRRRVEEIKKCTMPKKTIEKWKCMYTCSYAKDCDKINKEIKELGIDKVTDKHRIKGDNYTGGGRISLTTV